MTAKIVGSAQGDFLPSRDATTGEQRNINEAIAEERRQRFERTPEEKRATAERLVEIIIGDQPAPKPSEGGEGGTA